jgi:hypothetical protein
MVDDQIVNMTTKHLKKTEKWKKKISYLSACPRQVGASVWYWIPPMAVGGLVGWQVLAWWTSGWPEFFIR